MELHNKSVSYRETESDQAININASLTKWWNDVDEHFEGNHSGSINFSAYHRMTLTVLHHELIIALNRYTPLHFYCPR